MSRSSEGRTNTTRDSDSEQDSASTTSGQQKEMLINKAREAKLAYEEIQTAHQASNSRLFSSMVNQISEVDLMNEDPTAGAVMQTLKEEKKEEQALQVVAPQQQAMSVGRKKKFVKRIVKKPNLLKEAEAKQLKQDRQSEKISQAVSDFKNGIKGSIAGMFDVW